MPKAIRWFVLSLPIVSCVGLYFACSTGETEQDIVAFLDKHWKRPIRPQGDPPPTYEGAETRLDAGSCGTCHPDQMRDWSGSFHSKAMSPGLLGQLMDMSADDREGHQACITCHAPLAEQADGLVEFLSALEAPFPEDAAISTDQGLMKQGLSCAVCHIRDYHVNGPPRRKDLPPLPSGKRMPHDGWNTTGAYEDSRFCKSCHQFDEDGGRLAGKLVENIHNEWRESRYFDEGKSCQSCHMPDRRHFWRGIHDSSMTSSGVKIVTSEIQINDKTVKVELTLTNSGVGHNFPSYLTPRVTLEAFQLSSDGEEVADSHQEVLISWEAPVNLDRENSDTRLAPDSSATLYYSSLLADNSSELILRVRIEPDEFYRRFYESLLEGGLTNRGEEKIKQALAESIQSEYILFERRISLAN